MARTAKFPHIERKGYNKYYAVLKVPADVQTALGRKQFVEPTGETDQAAAFKVAQPMIDSWKWQIEQARQPDKTPPRWLVEHYAYILAQHMGTPTYDHEEGWAEAILDLARERYPNGGPIEAPPPGPLRLDGPWRPMKIDELLQEAPPSPSSEPTPFLAHIEGWYEATNLKGSNRDIVRGHIRAFAKAVEEPLGSLEQRHVQKWATARLKGGDSLSTVTKKLSNIRLYWKYMAGLEIVDRECPFIAKNLNLADHRDKVQQGMDIRLRWLPEDVSRIITAAWERNPELGAVTEIAAFSGARRGSIAGLNVKHIRTFQGVQVMTFADKTAAGIRVVPLVPRLRPLIAQLTKNATADGFLFHGKPDKYGARGGGLGKMFGSMTTAMTWDEGEEYRKQRDFHSIRHTVVRLFRDAGCPVEIRNEILGHEDGTKEGSGAVYGQGAGPAIKLEWMLKVLNYPDFPAVI